MLNFKRRYCKILIDFNNRWGTDFIPEPLKPSYYSGDTWVNFTSGSLPNSWKFRHRIQTSAKAATGKVELAFQNIRFDDVKELISTLFGVPPVANGKYKQHVAVELDVAEIRNLDDLATAESLIGEALVSADRLYRIACQHRSSIESILAGAAQTKSTAP